MIGGSGILTPVSLVAAALFLLYYWITRKPKKFPPGPRWLPVLGSALEVGKLRKETGYFSEACNILVRRYKSPIIGLKIGHDLIIVINDYESMKAMITNEVCDGRPVGPVYESRTFGKRQGLLVVDGHLWVEQRRYILRGLRDFGFGRTDMGVQIELEATQLVKHYEKLIDEKAKAFYSDEPAESVDPIAENETNKNNNDNNKNNNNNNNNNENEEKKTERRRKNVTKIYEDSVDSPKTDLNESINEKSKTPSAGDFYAKFGDDPEVRLAAKMPGIIVEMEDFFGVPVLNTLWCMMAGKRYNIDDKELIYLQKVFTALLRDVDMIGCLFQHFPYLKYLAPEMSGYKKFMEIHQELWKFLENELENHKRTFDPSSLRGMMDVYLQVLQTEAPGDTFSEEQLMSICVDLFMAGSETTAKALSFGFLFLTLNQRVQKKAQEEIDTVIGRERMPTLNDRPRMTYLSAIVLESLRMFMGRTMNIPHRAMKNTTLMGYHIPKNSMLVVNFNRILMDESWGDPEEFRPERFIDENGKLFIPEQFLPFSFGRHRCMGEVLAKSNLFMITAALLQNFTFSPVPGEDPPQNDYTDGVTASPKPYRVLMTKRS